MAFLYSDPYKDDPYGKLKGDKSNDYFSIIFDEAKIYPTDNGYVIAAYATSYENILRSFRPENGIDPGLVAIPLYNSDYDLRMKVNGEYASIKCNPSKFEKAVCDRIKSNEANLVGDGKFVSGKITHLPNGMVANYTDETLKPMVDSNLQLEIIPTAPKLKEYKVPGNYQQRKGGSWGNKEPTMDEKLLFVKAELVASIRAATLDTNSPLGHLTKQFVDENVQSPDFVQIYLDLISAIIK